MVAREPAVQGEGVDRGVVHRGAGCGQDPVDAGATRHKRPVPVERPVGLAPVGRRVPGVDEAGAQQRVVHRVPVGGDVEVPRHDHRQGAREPGDALGDQGGGPLACVLAGVVQMGVEDVELPVTGAQIAEADPGDHAEVGAAPGVRGDRVRRVGQPEVVVLQRDEPAGVVEDRHELVAAAARPADADPVVGRPQVGLDVAQLLVEALLGADEVRLLAAQQPARHGPAGGPAVGLRRTREAQVERHGLQRPTRTFPGRGGLGGSAVLESGSATEAASAVLSPRRRVTRLWFGTEAPSLVLCGGFRASRAEEASTDSAR
ncbi:hypothetical protein ACVW19_000926 [Streptomyces sp. TE5632]